MTASYIPQPPSPPRRGFVCFCGRLHREWSLQCKKCGYETPNERLRQAKAIREALFASRTRLPRGRTVYIDGLRIQVIKWHQDRRSYFTTQGWYDWAVLEEAHEHQEDEE